MAKLFLKGINDAFILGWTLVIISIACLLFTSIYGYASFFAVTGFSVTGFEAYKGDVVTGASGGSADSESYKVDISVGDVASGEFESENYKAEMGAQAYLGKDETPPELVEQYVSTSAPKKGSEVILSVQWKDDSPPISVEFWDSHNNWSEAQSVYSLQPAEFIFDTAGLDGTIKWKSRAKDIFENSNTSGEKEFTIGAVDEEKPKVSDIFNSNDKPVQGEKITLNVRVSDNFRLKEVVFEINGVKQEPKKVSGKEETVSFEVDTSEFSPGTEVKWKAYVKDGVDLETISDLKIFTVQAAPEIPAEPTVEPKVTPPGIKKTCVDGTEYGKCSKLKPKYCSDGNFIDKCSECGCPSGFECDDITELCERTGAEPFPVTWISVGVIAAAVIGFAGFLLLKRKPEKGKAPVKEKPK